MSREARLADGTVLRFPDNTSDEVMQAAVKRHLGVAAPVTSRGGAPSTIGPRNPGFFESFGEQAGDIAGSVLELPGAAVDAVKTLGNPYEPQKALGFLKDVGSGVVDAIKGRLNLIPEGRVAEFAGRTAADVASAVIPGKVGAMVRPAKSVAGGSGIVRVAEELGIQPKRQWFGMRDKLTADPLHGAPGDQSKILAKSTEAANTELARMGVPPVTDATSVDSLRRAVKTNISGAEATAAEKAQAAIDAARTKAIGDLTSRVGAPVDPSVASDAVVRGVSTGRSAASNVLGGAVAEAKKPFLSEPINAQELARIARGYGQEFPGVVDASGKLLFEEGAGPGLTYGAVDDIKRKLGYIGSDKNRAASSLSRDLQESALGELKGRGLDTSKIEAAQAAYKSGYADPYLRGQPARVLKGAIAGKPVAALNIPLKEGAAWEQLVASLDDPVRLGGDDVVAATKTATVNKEMLRRHVANNNMGLSQGLEPFIKNWRAASPRMKTAVFGDAVGDVDAVLRDYGSVASARPGEIVKTPRLLQLEEVWNQYAPTRNLTDSPFLPHTPTGLARLLAVSMATKSTGALRHGLYQATRLGRPAMLYNLVAKQTRIDRKRPPEDVQSFEQFLEEKQQ
jgi:hypothetical protein